MLLRHEAIRVGRAHTQFLQSAIMRQRAVAFADQTLVGQRAQALLKRRPGMTLHLPGHQVVQRRPQPLAAGT